MKFFYRFLLILITILFMFVAIVLAIYSFGFTEGEALYNLLDNLNRNWQAGLLFLLIFILGVWALYPFFALKENTTFAEIKSTELGEINISLRALKNLVEGIVFQQNKMQDIDIKLKRKANGLEIFIAGDVKSKTVIPEMTNELQQVVKDYIEDTTGVSVREVRILVNDIHEHEASRVD